MTPIIYAHLWQLLAIFLASVSYFILHYACYWLGLLLSGKKSGVCRQLLQGFLLVACFAVAMLLSSNGDIKYYHIIVYALFLLGFFALKKLVCRAIKQK